MTVTESEWRDAIKIARILKHRTYPSGWRIRVVVALAAYLLGQHAQAEEIRTRTGEK